MNRLKLDLVPPRHQLHAVPFSDEWLAALEAFGEVSLLFKRILLVPCFFLIHFTTIMSLECVSC